jgi:3-phytase
LRPLSLATVRVTRVLRPFIALSLLSLGACGFVDTRQSMPLIAERWISEATPESIDSVASWRTSEDKMLVFATAKDSGTVRVYDASDGRFLRSLGNAGTALGEFDRPNGIFIVDDLAFVVERDNHRVQVVALDSNRFLGSFGVDDLRVPYGLWVWPQGDRRFRIYVTDSYYTPDDRVPPADQLGERVKLFDVSLDDDAVDARLVRTFGETAGDGVLNTVESIWGDPANGRLLIADENARRLDVKVYDLSGHFTGVLVGSGQFDYEPEGIALIECGTVGDGYWLISDQHASKQVFRLFDRRTLAPVGAFLPQATRMVDGVWFQPGAFAGFVGGALFSQHADKAVVAFDWTAIASTLGLRTDCGR